MPFAEINGYRMHYSVFGGGDALVMVLIHGGLDSVSHPGSGAPHAPGR